MVLGWRATGFPWPVCFHDNLGISPLLFFQSMVLTVLTLASRDLFTVDSGKPQSVFPFWLIWLDFFFSFASGFLSLCVHSAFLVLSSVPHPEGHLFVLIKTCIFFFFTIFWWIFWNTPFPDIPMALFRNWINISLSLCNLSMDLTH